MKMSWAERTPALWAELVSRLDDQPDVLRMIPDYPDNILSDISLDFTLDSKAEFNPILINFVLSRVASGEFGTKEPWNCFITHYKEMVFRNMELLVGTKDRWITFSEEGVFVTTFCGYPETIAVVYANIYPGATVEEAKAAFEKQLAFLREACNVGWIEDWHYFEPELVRTYETVGDYVFNVALSISSTRPFPSNNLRFSNPLVGKPTRRAVNIFLWKVASKEIGDFSQPRKKRYPLN